MEGGIAGAELLTPLRHFSLLSLPPGGGDEEARGGQREGHPERTYTRLLPSSLVLTAPSSLFAGPEHFVSFTVHQVGSPPWPLPCPALLGEPATPRDHRILLNNPGKGERPGGYDWVALWS